jgi:DNA-directed RNA polymerase specialized sigma24 family protein
MRMQDQEVVAAIVAGDPDGIAEAYDRYAAPLYVYCSFMLPGPDAAAVVRDTFLIATTRLEGLRDPGKLRSWLHAVARSECLRRRSLAGVRSPLPKTPRPASGDGAWPAVELPAELRGQVLTACTDSTPAGRAERASTAHRAGAFGPTGFPKAAASPGPPWRRQLRRHPRAAAAVAALVAVGVTAGVIVTLPVGASHRAQASTFANAGGAGSPGATSASPSPGRQASPTKGQPTPSVTAPTGTVSPGSGTPRAPAAAPGTSRGSASPTASPSSSESPSASPTPTPTPTPTATPTQGILEVVPDELVLTSSGGKAVSGDFILTTVGGPVGHYAITVPASLSGKIEVSPATGSLPDGGWVTVTVTVTSKTAVKADVTVNPGRITVTVVLDIKALGHQAAGGEELVQLGTGGGGGRP